MVLTRLAAILALCMLAAPAIPAAAHESHLKEGQRAKKTGRVSTPGAIQERMEDQMVEMENQRPQTFSGRLGHMNF